MKAKKFGDYGGKVVNPGWNNPFGLKLALNALYLGNKIVSQQSDNQGLEESMPSYHYVQIETNRIDPCQEN